MKTVDIRVYNLGGINTYTNPFLAKDGEAVRSVNMISEPYGAKSKRTGFSTFLGTADGGTINSLFSWTKNDGSLFLYRASGSALYYSTQGTGAWTLAGNGTITNGGHVGYTVLGDTLILGDGAGSTRHTTTGTAFTNTTLAPVGEHFEQFQGRVYIGGTASTLFYSSANDATNWNTSGTSDSSSLNIPGAGKINKVFKSADRLLTSKTSGQMYKWDGDNLIDMTTLLGPSSPYSVAQKEGFRFYLNSDGYYGYGGGQPELISNNIESQIYNKQGNAISGTVFSKAPAEVHRYDYLSSVGTVTDGYTGETITNCVQKYDFKKNEWLDFSLGENPTALHSYTDINGVRQLIFGGSGGQVFKFDPTVYSDNGNPIYAKLEYVIDADNPEADKEWRWITVYTNPGCQAKCQIAVGDAYRKDSLNWIEIGDMSAGVTEFRLPSTTSRGKVLFVRFYESSTNAPFTIYGFTVNAVIEEYK